MPLNLQSLMIDSSDVESLDGSLALACAQWHPMMNKAQQHMQAGESEPAIECASEAIRLSALWHPQYHFLESGLHTAVGALYLAEKHYAMATQNFSRALFLHHDNTSAHAGLCAAQQQVSDEIPPYTEALSWQAWCNMASCDGVSLQSELFEKRLQAENSMGDSAFLAYEDATKCCDATHQAYHRLAAQPWWLRASLFMEQGEDALAKNDLRRGLNLDRTNSWATKQLRSLESVQT
ncbi:MAG: hypothetical protein K2Q12_02115 [Rickettsiales bacterium]|nr:hypothetical protein [Rickettsiales bacterium]